MAIIEVKNWEGETVDSVVLDLPVAREETSAHIVHRALIRQQANSRQGTASTKTRAEVRGGGRKPWRQKGTGRARAGSSRSPLWRGGGVAFGPKPRKFNIKMNRKERRLALQTAFQNRADDMIVVDNFEAELPRPKTKEFVKALNRWGDSVKQKSILLVLEGTQNTAYLSARNVANVKVINAQDLNILDILTKDLIVITRQALELISSRFSPIISGNQKNRLQSVDSLKRQQRSLCMPVFKKVNFPDKVCVGRTYNLEVSAEPLEETLDSSFSKVDIWVLVSPEYFELQSPEVQTLEIASNGNIETASVIFKLTPKKIGSRSIKVDFLRGTRYLGRQELSTTISA